MSRTRPATAGRCRGCGWAVVAGLVATLGTVSGLSAPTAAAQTATAASTVVVPAAGVPAAALPDEPADEPAGARIELVSMSPPVVDPAAVLAVRVAVHNDGVAALAAGLDVDLMVQRSQLSTRASVAAWPELDLDDAAVGSLVARQQLATDLPPGAQVTVDFSVPAAELRLPADTSQWGPRGVSLLLRQDDGRRLAVARTHLVWYPGQGFDAPTTVSVVVPVTAGAPDPTTGLVPLDRLQELTAPGAALDGVLAAAATPGVAVALDPAVLDPTVLDPTGLDPAVPDPAVPDPAVPDPAGQDPTAPAGGGAGGATGSLGDWTARLQDVTAAGETLLLPYGDADLTSLAHAGATELALLAQERGRDAVQRVLRSAVRTDVAWPLGGDTDTTVLAGLRELGYSGVVLSEGSMPPVQELRAAVTGRATLDTGGEPVAALLADTPLSNTLAAVGGDGTGSRSPAAAVQRLLAETAAVTLQRPSDPRHLLVAAPRGWAPAPAAAAAAAAALTTVPWVAPATVAALLDAEAPDVERTQPRLTADEVAAELPTDGLRDTLEQVEVLRRLATAVPDPSTMTAPAQATAVALASGAWRTDVDAWRAAVTALAAARGAVQGAVRVVPGSPLTQVSREVELPVTIENTLDQDVSLVLGVRSTSSRLAITGDVAVQVGANSTQLAYVPVRGVGSGEATVIAQARAPAGASFGDPVATQVTVRADWETRGTLVVAVVAGLVLLGGLARTIRRGRRPRGHDPLAGPPPPRPDDAPPVPTRAGTLRFEQAIP